MNRLRAARALLGAILIGLLAHLLFGDKPWEPEIAERFSSGKGRPIDLARVYRWWIALANAGLVSALWLTAPRWLGPPEPPVDPALPPPRARLRGFGVLVAAAVACAAVLAWPRLEFGFWDDEAYTVFHSIDGGYETDPRDGKLKFRPVEWREALLYTAKWPNNHVPNTILARLTLASWRAIAKPELPWPDERAVRIPAYAAGLAAIVATALCLRRLGLPRAGVFAAWLLALHPWHLRYTSEARGYALLLLFVPLLVHALLRAFERGSWARWLAFAFVGALILWTYPGAVGVVAIANLAVLGVLGLRVARGVAGAPTQATRWGVANLVAAGVFAQVMLPNVLMFMFNMPFTGDRDLEFVRHVLAHLWMGQSWAFRRFNEHYAEVADFARTFPWLFRVLLAVTLAGVALGVARLVRRGGVHAAIAAALLLPAPITLALVLWRETQVHEWYLIFGLPSAVLLLAIGLDGFAAWIRAPRARPAAAAAVLAAYLGAYAFASQPIRSALRAGSVIPAREAVAFERPERDPFDPANERILTVGWLTWYYDPLLRNVNDVGAAMAEADATGKTLYVLYSRPELTRRRLPELVALSEDPARFELVKRWYGYEPRGHILVFKYRGGGTGGVETAVD
jgi:hypothetical protein